MTSVANRPHQALLVIDVQTAVVAKAFNRDAVVATISSLVELARAAETPVIWVQHNDDDLPSGAPGWEIVDELVPLADEVIVHKSFRDSFEDTKLDSVLADAGIGHLVVTGAQSDYCVRWTLHGAHTRGYATTLVADAHTTDDPPTAELPAASQTIAQMNNVWASQAAEGRTASVMAAAEIRW